MDQIKIGKFIAECRKNKNMTQAQLAEKVGVTDRAVSKWENGRSMPDSSIMLELCGDRVGKPAKIGKHLARSLVLHHLNAKLGICGVHRNVNGRDMHLDYTVNISVSHIGESDVISVEKGKA